MPRSLDDQGALYTASLRSARQTDAYTFRGDGEEVFEPRFTAHGFRYAEVSGLSTRLQPDQLTARAVTSMGPPIGTFECSDELVNAIHRNVVWGLRDGLIGIPIDCPQRDERLGWAGDAAAMAPSALFLGDTAALFEKWLIDLSDAQLPSGAYPDVAPRIGVTGSGNAGWADAGVLVPWTVYRQTGNVGVIERQYDSMRRYLRFLEADHVGGIRHGGRYGDWLALEGPTSLELIGTAYLARRGRLLRGDGSTPGSRRRRRRHRPARLHRPGRLPTAVHHAIRHARGTRPRRAMPSRSGSDCCRRARRRAAADRLAALIEAADGHLLTGFLGTALVLHALSDHGHHELATRVVRQDTYPGWGFEVRQGATTIWERWDCMDAGARVRRSVDELVQPCGAGLGGRVAPRGPRGPRPRGARLPDDARSTSAGRRDRSSSGRPTSRPMAATRSSGWRMPGGSRSRSRCRPTRSPTSSCRAMPGHSGSMAPVPG